MGMGVVAGRRGIVSDMNVVPLIDILLVLLVIFMIIPHQKGLDAALPQQQTDRPPGALQSTRSDHRSDCLGWFGSNQSVRSTVRSVGRPASASFRTALRAGCVSSSRSFAGLSSGCAGS